MEVFQKLDELSLIFLPLMAIIMALVEVWGRFGAKGKVQLASSLGTGLVLGGGFAVLVVQPANAVGWTTVGMFGLIVGLSASGVYNVGKGIASRATDKLVQRE